VVFYFRHAGVRINLRNANGVMPDPAGCAPVVSQLAIPLQRLKNEPNREGSLHGYKYAKGLKP